MDKCPDCAVEPGVRHHENCDVARCTLCGFQWLFCDCLDVDGSDPDVWTGEWPGDEACREFDLWCKWTDSGGWETCGKEDPLATEDLNRLQEVTVWDPALQKRVLI